MGAGRVLKPKQYAKLSNEVTYKKQPSTQFRACSTINISKYVEIFLSYFFLRGGGLRRVSTA